MDNGNPSHPPGSSVLLLVICQTLCTHLMTAQFENCKFHTFSIDTSSFQQPYIMRNLQFVVKGAKWLLDLI